MIRLVSLFQVTALLAMSLVLGSMFGIWRGYDPQTYSMETFVEVHQGAVRGLNILLPALAFVTIAITLLLTLLGRKPARVRWLYAIALLCMIVGGLITRFGNQPINDIIMNWSSVPPPDWSELRDRWWSLHVARLAVSFVAWGALVAAIFSDRDADQIS